MKNLKLTAAVLALASSAMVAGTAKAVTTFNPGDVFLGVEDVTGTVPSDYVVDLGNISFFQSATGTINLGNVSADLTTAFGSSPFSNANLEYGIIGTSGNLGASGYVANTIFISNPQLVNGVPNVPLLNASNAAQGNYRSNISSFEGGGPTFGAFGGQNANGTVFPNATITSSSGPNSFTSQESSSGTGGFGTGYSDLNVLSGDSDLDVLVPEASGVRVPTPGTDLGYFSFDTSGDLLFTSTAVATPEPSTYALLVAGGLVLVWQMRRRALQA